MENKSSRSSPLREAGGTLGEMLKKPTAKKTVKKNSIYFFLQELVFIFVQYCYIKTVAGLSAKKKIKVKTRYREPS